MRLICPNCGAQYEVADDVIPQGGRDVQCSNCGHTWLETPGASVAAEDDTPDDSAIPQSWEVEEDPADFAPEPDLPERERENFIPPQTDEDRLAAAPTPPGSQDDPQPQRQSLDPSIADILREEASREEQARAAERETGLQSQGDLGLSEGQSETEAQREREARDRMSRLKGEETEVSAAVAATVASSRKELLPDIEEINSTLRPSSDRVEAHPLPEELEERERRGFRFGFMTVLGVIVVLSLIYLFADQIADAVPALSSALEAYVNAVNGLRIWLDVKIQGLLGVLEASDDTA